MKELARQIIESAIESDNDSMFYFERFNEENDYEMKQIYWTRCQEYDGKTVAYLDCYRMITGKTIRPISSEIKNEYAIII